MVLRPVRERAACGAAMMGNRGKEAKEEDKAWGKKA